MAQALEGVTIRQPSPAVVANVVGHAISDPAEIRRRLVEQVTGLVRWRECVAWMAQEGVTRFYEVGAGKVLSGLVKRITGGATATSVGTPEDIRGFGAAQAA
jgi:[acyl-carrier-protein] S-malonyltransferase